MDQAMKKKLKRQKHRLRERRRRNRGEMKVSDKKKPTRYVGTVHLSSSIHLTFWERVVLLFKGTMFVYLETKCKVMRDEPFGGLFYNAPDGQLSINGKTRRL